LPLIAEIVQTENKVQAKAPEIQKALFERLATVIIVGLLVNILVALGLVLSFSKDFVERIAAITAHAKLLPLTLPNNYICCLIDAPQTQDRLNTYI
jgi:hypothetical protein